MGMIYNNLGISLFLDGRYEKAIDSFQEALKTEDPKGQIYNNLAMTLCKLGRYGEAFEVFKKGGNEAEAYNNLGYIYLLEGKNKEAIDAFEKALDLSPGFYVRAYENLNRAKTASPDLPSR